MNWHEQKGSAKLLTIFIQFVEKQWRSVADLLLLRGKVFS